MTKGTIIGLTPEIQSPLERGRQSMVAMLSVRSLYGLFRVASSDESRVRRNSITGQGSPHYRMTGEDLQALVSRGYVTASKHWIEMTDAGNKLMRELVAVVNSKGEGAGV